MFAGGADQKVLKLLRGYSDSEFFYWRLFQYKIWPITQKSGKKSLPDEFDDVDVIGCEVVFIFVF